MKGKAPAWLGAFLFLETTQGQALLISPRDESPEGLSAGHNKAERIGPALCKYPG